MRASIGEIAVELESRYELLEKIGTGSYATVFRARDTELGREVAIKQIHQQYLDNPEQLDRYWQEAQLLASLQHPNIVTIFDIYRDRGWLILELMQGNLADKMEGRQMDLRALRTTLAHCLRALKYLHSRGVVHGDIKPSNLMIDARKRVKIGDFGLARRVSDDDGSLLKGTTKYMAPEVVSDEFGEIGPASDLYSLGFAAYDLMCGPNFESLFPGLSAFGRNKQVAWMMWHAAADRRLPEIGRVLEGVPDDLKKVIQKLAEKDQAKRYKTADEALSDLNIDLKVVQKGGDGGDEVVGLTQTVDAGKKKRTLIAAGALAFSVILSLVMLFVPGGSQKPSDEPSKMISGIVRSVDAATGQIVVEDIEKGIPKKYKMATDPAVYLLNTKRNILLEELQPRDRVEWARPADGGPQEIAKITVSRPVVSQGTIRTVNLQGGSIVIAVEEGDQRDDVPIRVPERTSVLINDKPMGLRDVNEGDYVKVRHFPEISGKGGRIAEEVSVLRLAETVGFVSDVEPEKKRLTVRSGAGTMTKTVTLPVAADCEITVKGRGGEDQTVALSDLVRDDRIRVLYDTEFRQITVTRDAKKVAGNVTEVRQKEREVVVRTATGKTYTLNVPEKIEKSGDVTLLRDSVTLADLRKDDRIEINYDDSAEGVSVASTLYAVRPTQSDRWVILIAGEVYDEKLLSPLSHSAEDVQYVQQAMKSRYAVQDDRVLILRDEKGAKIKEEVEKLLKLAGRQTQVVVYATCHAYVGPDKKAYLAGRDFRFDDMAKTGVALQWLVDALDGCASEDKILLLDSSHKGVGRDLQSQPSTSEMVGTLSAHPASTAIVASCSEGERGLPMQGQERGVFAHCVADAFAGRADVNLDLRVTAQELYDHLHPCMQSTPADQGGKQTPALFLPKE